MIIDIEPMEREPSQFERIIMEIKGYKELYFFVQDGKEFSVYWTDETIKDFLPSWCVSEYIENHQQRYAAMFAHCMCAWEHQRHPYWTVPQQELVGNEWRFTGREVPKPLHDQHDVSNARYWLKHSYEQFTKPLEFVVVRLKPKEA